MLGQDSREFRDLYHLIVIIIQYDVSPLRGERFKLKVKLSQAMRSTSEVRRNSSHRPLRRLTSQDATDHTEPKRKWKLWPVPEIFQFAIVSGLAGALVNAIYTFFPSIMTTIEKRFNINNQRLSYILMANDISGILIGPFSTYYMAKKNIPKSLSFGMCFNIFNRYIKLILLAFQC